MPLAKLLYISSRIEDSFQINTPCLPSVPPCKITCYQCSRKQVFRSFISKLVVSTHLKGTPHIVPKSISGIYVMMFSNFSMISHNNHFKKDSKENLEN